MSQPESPSKHSLQVDISEDAINEALAAVESRAPGEAVTAVELDMEVDPPAAMAEEPPATAEESPAAAEEADPAALRAEIELRDQLLEQSAVRMQQAMQRLQEANDLRLRAVADLENYKKRAIREREEVQKFGIEKVLAELIPVLDNFDRALEAAGDTTDLPSFVDGVRMNRRLFEETLARFGVKAFTAVGEVFDPHFHEALQQVESDVYPANVVARELVRGYLLNDRLVRPALVAVSSGPGPAESGGTQD